MLKNFFSEEPTPVDELIDTVIEAMANTDPATDEYAKLTARLSSLNEIKTASSRKPVSSDTIMLCLVSLFEVGFIVVVENTHLVSSLGHRLRLRPKGL